MAKVRDYKVEYARRLAKASARGFSRSQARGHPKRGEDGARGPPKAIPERQLQAALKAFAKGKSLKTAAQEAKVAPERLRAFASEKKYIAKEGRRWELDPNLPRRVQVISEGQQQVILVTKSEASKVNQHNAAVSNFLRTNKVFHLAPFKGEIAYDLSGREYPLETDPRLLYRLLHTGDHTFEQIYRIEPINF